MISNRICIIATPRSGSQFVADIISSTHNNVVNISEPFEHTLTTQVTLINNKIHPVDTYECNATAEEKIKTTLSALSADPEQGIVMRVFPKMYKLDINGVFIQLEKLGFKFLILRRNNIEHQILSYGIAMASNVWSRTKQEEVPAELIVVDKNKIKDIHETLMQFEKLVSNLQVEYDTIYYESAVANLADYFKMPTLVYNGKFKKQGLPDPYSIVLNAQEIAQTIKTLIIS
jgi:LPS sulfotransferase NodH